MNETTALAPTSSLVPESLPSREKDTAFVELWLGTKVSVHTRRAYAADTAGFLAFAKKSWPGSRSAISRPGPSTWGREVSNPPARIGRSPP